MRLGRGQLAAMRAVGFTNPGNCGNSAAAESHDARRRKTAVCRLPRSDVPPFMVMDVVAAAARHRRAGRPVVHMEVGQPAAPAPRPPSRRRARRSAARWPTRNRSAFRPLRERIARHYGDTYNFDVARARSSSQPARRRASFSPFSRMFDPGRPRRLRGAGLSAFAAYPDSARLRARADRDTAATRYALTGEVLFAEHRKSPLKGVLVASPANPTGTMMTAAGAGRSHPRRGRRRHSRDLR